MRITERLSLIDLAYVLFVSPLQEREHPTSAQVREAIGMVLLGCGADCSDCVSRVAQEAGDHPDCYQPRMRWALAAVHDAYRPAVLLAS